MSHRLPANNADDRSAQRIRELEQRLAQLERTTPVRQVTGWGTDITISPPAAALAPFGALAIDTNTKYLWVSVGSAWLYVTYVGP